MTRTTGPNFEVEERSDGVAVVRVWRRPDLSREEGARCADLMTGHMRRLAPTARGCVFDLTEATASWGPATNKALGEMLAAWESARKPLFVVHGPEAIQKLLLRELQRTSAPRHSRLVASRQEAEALLAEPKPPRRG